MNAFLKKDLEEDIFLWMFLRHCDNGLAALRYTEMNEHDKTTMTEPLLNQTTMPFVEEQAASIFTREIFDQVKREIICVDQYVVNVQPDQLPDYDICKVSKYMQKDPKRQVFYSRGGDDLRCDCCWFETKGIPCRHIFATMKHLNKSEFPPSCLVNNRPVVQTLIPHHLVKREKGVVENTRYGGVSILVAFYATKSRAPFNKVMKVLSDLVMDLKEMARKQGDDPLSKNETIKEMPFEIKDPKPVQKKGRPVQFKASQSNFSQGSGKRKAIVKLHYCINCEGTGHDSRNCPETKNGRVQKETKLQKK